MEFSDKKLRSDFRAERDRVLRALAECEKLDGQMTEMLDTLRASLKRAGGGGASSLFVRVSEQQIANRNQRLALIKELSVLKRDILDREFRLTKEEKASGAAGGNGTAVGPALLAHLQSVLLGPGATLVLLEPGAVDSIIAKAAGVPSPAQGAPSEGPQLPDPADLGPGDLVADRDGRVWAIGDDGAPEDTCATADRVVLDTGESPAYAVLADGRHLLVVEFD
jgi:hypothetical protein